MTDDTSVSDLKRLAEEYIEARERGVLPVGHLSSALTPERVVALTRAAGALQFQEDCLQQIREGDANTSELAAISKVKRAEALAELQAAFAQEKPDAG